MPRRQSQMGSAEGRVDPKQWAALQADLRRFPGELRKQFNQDMRNVANRVATDARRRAPVRTGALRKAITVSVTKDHVKVLSKVPYARMVEYGGRHPVFQTEKRNKWVNQKPRPHIAPAVKAARPEFEKQAAEAIRKAALHTGWR